MPYYQYDDRQKTREEDAKAIEEYISNGGKVSVLLDDKKMKILNLRSAANKRNLKKLGIEVVNIK